jgi:putative ABC transport system ATP-binding protein
MRPIVETKALSRDFVMASHTINAVRDVDLRVEPGTMLAIQGRSGSGKTTLLNLMGGLDAPTSGTVWIDGLEVTSMDEADLVEVRRNKIGFVFQTFGLVPILTAEENVQLPMRLTKLAASVRQQRARVLLGLVGLADRAAHRPDELSGGEQQRVAIARALANEPRLLIADEPTGQLDSRTGRSIVDLISALVRSENVAAVVATHDPAPLAAADRVVRMSDGRIID